MTTIVKSGRASSRASESSLCAAVVALVILAGCAKPNAGQDEMAWARAALNRNDQIQVVATDAQARTFTVRLKDSGEVRVVSVDRIIAVPMLAAAESGVGKPDGGASTSAAGSGSVSRGASHSDQAPPLADTQSGSVATSSGSITAAGTSTGAPADGKSNGRPAFAMAPSGGGAAAGSTTAEAGSAPGGAGAAGAAAARAASAQPGEAATSALAQATPAQAPGAGFRPAGEAGSKGGRLLASGPGYSIEASGSKGTAVRAAAVTTSHGTPVERHHDPIICQGARLLHIDNRNLEFDGDAVSAEDGCELHITNTRISAKGIGVLARAASVHIENSDIEGDSGAIDASDGAQVYAETSTFKGLTRRLDNSAFHDLGGNAWR